MESLVLGVEKTVGIFLLFCFLCSFHFLVKTWCLYVSLLTSYSPTQHLVTGKCWSLHEEVRYRCVFHNASVTSLCLFGIYKYSIFNACFIFFQSQTCVLVKHVSVDKLRNILEASAPAQGGGLSFKSWRGRWRICLSFLLWWFDPNARLCRLQSTKA